MKETISVLDIFKIGIGPSSSHTLGPWRAAQQFLHSLQEKQWLFKVSAIRIVLYGSLAKTGRGHGTDIAVQLGLSGHDPVTFDVSRVAGAISHIRERGILLLGGRHAVGFDPAGDISFAPESLPYHPNGLRFLAELGSESFSQTWYSVGGGFIEQENEPAAGEPVKLPFPVHTAADILHWCTTAGIDIPAMVMANENSWRPEPETRQAVLAIWRVMQECMFRGCHTEGILPGWLGVKRRAAELNQLLLDQPASDHYGEWIRAIRHGGNHFTYTLDWVSCFALAVNEENASFGRVVTAPTNGAAGVIPAVLQYYVLFCGDDHEEAVTRFLLTASEIGCIFKKGATISAAMGGCQAEIGVSSAMAAAGLTQVLGGSTGQVLMAAEIAMEHHLGLTCDPVGGLVQVPCIERNTMGAIKAITASRLALQGSPAHAKVSLDQVITTMWNTALDMNSKYKETADGGLAIAIPISLSEC